MTNNEIVMQGSPSMENGFLMKTSEESAKHKNYALKLLVLGTILGIFIRWIHYFCCRWNTR